MIIFNKKNFIKNSGYSIIEMLFYIALFAVISIVVINSMIVMMKSFKETAIQSELVESGNIMERIGREIRQAFSISSINISDGNNLKLCNDASCTTTTEFNFSSPNIQFKQNSGSFVNLNPSNITVTALSFTQIATTKGFAVKISLSVRSNHDSLSRVENFYNTVVLRGGY